jgi:RND family efflux transporter MFP subunit
MKRFFVLLSLLAVTSLLGGCRSGESARASGESAGAREVRVARAERGALPNVVTVSGTLAAEEQVVLGMKVAGRVAELSVDLGSRVEQGQVMARLDPTDFRLRVQQAEAALQQARSRLGLAPEADLLGSARDAPRSDDHNAETVDRVDPEQTSLVRQARAVMDESRLRRDRARQLFKEQLVPKSELDAAEANFVVAESRYQDALEEVRNRQALLAQRRSELQLARQQFTDAVLRAPFAGAVRERQASLGQYLDAGQPLFTLVRMHPLRLRVAVPERDAAGIRVGQEVRVAVEGDPNVYAGRVARASPAIEETSRTLMVEAEVPNPAGVLRPGSFARAEIVTSADLPVVFVPDSAIVQFAGIEKVFLVNEGRAVEQRVRTGRRHGRQVEIIQGINAGDTVVVEPGNLVGGQPVTIVP